MDRKDVRYSLRENKKAGKACDGRRHKEMIRRGKQKKKKTECKLCLANSSKLAFT